MCDLEDEMGREHVSSLGISTLRHSLAAHDVDNIAIF